MQSFGPPEVAARKGYVTSLGTEIMIRWEDCKYTCSTLTKSGAWALRIFNYVSMRLGLAISE